MEQHCTCHNHEENKNPLVKIIIGASLFGVAILFTNLFEMSWYLELAIYLASYIMLGQDVVLHAAKNIAKGRVFDENFLMSIATLGAFAVGEFPEAVAVMLFYQIGEYFQEAAVKRSKRSITELMDIRPDYANITSGGELIRVSPETVNIGDIIIVKPGERIPLDGIVLSGKSMLDTSALTGESMPRPASPGNTVLSGCINQSGMLEIEVTKIFRESTVAKIIDLVENAASKKAPTENFITTFSRYYTPVVVGLAALLCAIPPLLTGSGWFEWIHRGLIFLVISCPCALVISIPLGFFGGIGGASKRGILVKGGNYLEALNNLDIVIFDKTGTLTEGVFKVTGVYPASGFTDEDLLYYAAHAEAFSNHPIAASIQLACGKTADKDKLSDYLEIPGHGVSVNMSGKTILAGSARLMEANNILFGLQSGIGTKVYVAAGGKYAGCVVISDEIKDDSKIAIAKLKSMGVRKTVMLTGDSMDIGKAVAGALSIDEYYAELLPNEKVERLEALDKQKRRGGKLAFVGDGINDAPVLARADIGIAMGGLGSDAAIEAADIVIMNDEPSKLIDAIEAAKFTKRIVWQNICFALGVKLLFLLIAAMGMTTMWAAVFADVGVALIAVLNAMRALNFKRQASNSLPQAADKGLQPLSADYL